MQLTEAFGAEAGAGSHETLHLFAETKRRSPLISVSPRSLGEATIFLLLFFVADSLLFARPFEIDITIKE